MTVESLHPQYLTISGQSVVVLDAADYERLAERADVWEPPLPRADEAGTLPALEAMAVSQARDILRARRRLGLTQVQLARLAGMRQATLNRIERAESRANVAAIDKIELALKAVASKTRRLRNAK